MTRKVFDSLFCRVRFKDDAGIFTDITGIAAFLPSFKADVFFNYREVLQRIPLIKAMLNSFSYIAVIIVLGLVVNSTLVRGLPPPQDRGNYLVNRFF